MVGILLIAAAMPLVSCTPTKKGLNPVDCQPNASALREGIVARSETIIYGDDNRFDPDGIDNTRLRDIALNSSVALAAASSLEERDDGFHLFTRPLYEAAGLCEFESGAVGSRFLRDPQGAFCSGTLIDDDLVLTAGHCVTDQSTCRGTKFLFGFVAQADRSAPVFPQDNVYSCRRLVIQQLSEKEDSPRLDYAVVQLDRPVRNRRPAIHRDMHDEVYAGMPVTLIGYPIGIPMKIDEAGTVRNARGGLNDFFVAEMDAFSGNSGSGVYNRAGEVIGVHVRGDSMNETVETSCGCRVEGSYPAGGGPGAQVSHVGSALLELCSRNWHDVELCGDEPSCGDFSCSHGETLATCPHDCTPICGDRVCDTSEIETCPNDCRGTSPG